MTIFYKREGIYIDTDKIEGLIPIIDNNYRRWCLFYNENEYHIDSETADIIKNALETIS